LHCYLYKVCTKIFNPVIFDKTDDFHTRHLFIFVHQLLVKLCPFPLCVCTTFKNTGCTRRNLPNLGEICLR